MRRMVRRTSQQMWETMRVSEHEVVFWAVRVGLERMVSMRVWVIVIVWVYVYMKHRVME